MNKNEIKKCTKCLLSMERTTEFFYRHSASRDGLTPRCKKCVNEDNKIQRIKSLKKNPEKIRRQDTERSKRHYWKNVERSREINRIRAAKNREDPEIRKMINIRKRGGGAGLTVDEFNSILEKQGHKCAICENTEENGAVWNLDHCHKTSVVRFILCNHCNRGLGAFRDNPKFMIKAAELITNFYINLNQESGPQPAIMEKEK